MIHLCNTCGCKDAESFDADEYNKDGSFKFTKPYVDCEGCGLPEDGNCDCYLDEEMIKDAKKGICPSCEYDNFNINKTCEECEVVINQDGPKYRMDAESFEGESPMMKNITALGVLALAIIIGKKMKR